MTIHLTYLNLSESTKEFDLPDNALQIYDEQGWMWTVYDLSWASADLAGDHVVVKSGETFTYDLRLGAPVQPATFYSASVFIRVIGFGASEAKVWGFRWNRASSTCFRSMLLIPSETETLPNRIDGRSYGLPLPSIHFPGSYTMEAPMPARATAVAANNRRVWHGIGNPSIPALVRRLEQSLTQGPRIGQSQPVRCRRTFCMSISPSSLAAKRIRVANCNARPAGISTRGHRRSAHSCHRRLPPLHMRGLQG
jgi:hypothetical protein